MVKKVKLSCNWPWRTTWLWDVETPTFSLNNRLTDCGKVVSLTRRPLFTPRQILGTHFCLRLSRPQGSIVRLEGLGKLKEKSHLIWTRLLACSILPQPTTLLRAVVVGLYIRGSGILSLIYVYIDLSFDDILQLLAPKHTFYYFI
jgi:hypothetical protein